MLYRRLSIGTVVVHSADRMKVGVVSGRDRGMRMYVVTWHDGTRDWAARTGVLRLAASEVYQSVEGEYVRRPRALPVEVAELNRVQRQRWATAMRQGGLA